MNAPAHAPATALPPALSGLVWKAGALARPLRSGWPTGFARLDAALPGGGWPQGAITELLHDEPGVGELQVLLPMLRTAPAERWVAWIAPPCLPYAPALLQAGLPLRQMLLVDAATRPEFVWSVRQALASGACHAVLAWSREIDPPALRRLQLAAEEADTPLFLFRPLRAAQQASPAVLRLRLAATDDGLDVFLLKRRGPVADEAIRLVVHARFRSGGSTHALDCPVPARSAPAGLHAGGR